MTSLLLIGGGGHARVVLDTVLHMGLRCHGVTAPTAPSLSGVSYVGDDESAFRSSQPRTAALGLGGTPRQGMSGTQLRKSVFLRFRDEGFAFPPLIGRGVLLSEDATLGSGVQLVAGAIVQPNVRIDDNVVVNTGACLDHDAVIQAHAMIAPRAVLCGGVVVGTGAYIGAGAVILQGVTIGADAVVAAGAVATTDVPDGGYVSRR